MATVEGLQELIDSMDALPLTLQKNLIVRALRKGAEPIRARAEELAPFLTGVLKESMMIQISEQTYQGSIAKIGPARKGFYGRFEEFGTVHQSADPFLRPALDEMKSEAVALIGEVLAAGIEKELRKR